MMEYWTRSEVVRYAAFQRKYVICRLPRKEWFCQ
jgi:hypothetical protein